MKKLFSLLLVVAMFASMSVVSFAATGANDASWEIVETADGITATYYITNPEEVSGFTAAIKFDATKVAADKTTPYTLGADFAGTTVSPGSKAGHVKYAQTFGTATDRYVTKTGKIEAISFNFTRVDADADLSAAFEYGTSLYVAKVVTANGEYTSAKNAANFAAPVYVDNRAPIVVDGPLNDEGVDNSVASTLTFYGRIGAEWFGEAYGIIIEGKDFFGAQPGDVVANGVAEFNFADFNGEFEIVLTNITTKGTAGVKTYQFFVGDYITEEATVVVE